jgi:hypothetical protein
LACELAKQHKKVLLIQPTRELIDKTVNEELLARPDPPNYRVIHGGTVSADRSVALELANYFKSSDDGGLIVLSRSLSCPMSRSGRINGIGTFLWMKNCR